MNKAAFFFVFWAAVLLLGNWIFVPFILRDKTHIDGFFIGIIAAILILVVGAAIKLLAE